ncbi:hypothetical protein LEP1GSC170_3468 [Leptospira interrogans serovar Bataviae str. HAI135]|nr:hypothetical protein LEP1GSC170_3468 [Leptospira interrogans serovar Bataviae str. HAI135]
MEEENSKLKKLYAERNALVLNAIKICLKSGKPENRKV